VFDDPNLVSSAGLAVASASNAGSDTPARSTRLLHFSHRSLEGPQSARAPAMVQTHASALGVRS